MLLLVVLLICCCWLFSEMKMWPMRRLEISDELNPTRDDRLNLRNSQNRAAIAKSDFAKAERRLANLRKSGLGLRRTNSGRYDGRNRLGRKLNKEIPRAQAAIPRYKKEMLVAADAALAMEMNQARRPNEWVKLEAFRLSNRITVILFSSGLVLFKTFDLDHGDLWVGATIGWGAVLWISKTFYKGILAKRVIS